MHIETMLCSFPDNMVATIQTEIDKERSTAQSSRVNVMLTFTIGRHEPTRQDFVLEMMQDCVVATPQGRNQATNRGIEVLFTSSVVNQSIILP